MQEGLLTRGGHSARDRTSDNNFPTPSSWFACYLSMDSIRFPTRSTPMDGVVKALIEHYQETYKLTYKLWQQRNYIFLILLGVIAAATLLTFRVPQAEPLLVDI